VISAWLPSFRLVAHRGGRGEGWPVENTIAAFDEARRRGAVAIEFDVRTARDGEVMVAHDVDLVRVAEDRRTVASLSRQELERLPLRDGSSRIPSLEEVVAWANANGVAMNCELKHDVPSRRVLAKAAARVLSAARVPLLVSSFDPVTLGLFAREAPGVPRAQLTEHAQGLERELLHRLAQPPLVQVVHPEYVEIDEAFVQRAKSRGLRVGTWTVNVPARAKRLLEMGVDYVITDDVGAMRDIVPA
jgi:glycerophosphoryl diester phosphodiesterase